MESILRDRLRWCLNYCNIILYQALPWDIHNSTTFQIYSICKGVGTSTLKCIQHVSGSGHPQLNRICNVFNMYQARARDTLNRTRASQLNHIHNVLNMYWARDVHSRITVAMYLMFRAWDIHNCMYRARDIHNKTTFKIYSIHSFLIFLLA